VTHPADIEDRVSAALRGEADRVSPQDHSLEAIRHRTAVARRRRRMMLSGVGAAALVAAAVAVPLLGRDDDKVTTADDRASTTTTTTEPDTTTSTTVPPPAPATPVLDQALWPDPAGELFTDPVAAVRSFVQAVIGVDDPPLSEFRATEPGAGEVDLFRVTEDGRTMDRVASTISVRQLDGEHWFVTMASSSDVQIATPEPGAEVTSLVAVTGQGHGFEATIVVSLRARTARAEVLANAVTNGGAGEALEPYSARLSFTDAPTPVGMVIASDTSGASVSVPGFSAVLVRLPEPGDGSPGGGTSTPVGPGHEFGSQPLWPFRTQAEADAWLATASEGHSPWHADAAATALAFTNGYLGFTEIDLVTSSDVRDDEAWIGVGYSVPSGQMATAAVIHLVRFGPDPDTPWEVVGTRDTALTLDVPSYGSSVSSPITVGGTITGVDENLRVQVRQPSSPAPIGESCCLPAGGDGLPWETTVSYAGATDPALTIVVSTGGHVQGVEIFAITGVHP
jgi:Immunoglobulin-like domain of bacterial spore germination